MSSKLRFQVHYSDGYISHDAYGVDLSAFERRECGIDKILERSFGSIRKFLHEIFNVNSKTHFLTVQTVTNWATEGDFLTGRYKETILTTIGVDCNKQVVPIAFAFVENKNTESWYWFLEHVKIHVVAARCRVEMAD